MTTQETSTEKTSTKKGPFEKVGECLYRYVPNGAYYGRVEKEGKQFRRCLRTNDRAAQRRRLLPASGYYEWHGMAADGKKQPYQIRRQDHRPLFFAGIWETDGEKAARAVIITNDATPQLAAAGLSIAIALHIDLKPAYWSPSR